MRKPLRKPLNFRIEITGLKVNNISCDSIKIETQFRSFTELHTNIQNRLVDLLEENFKKFDLFNF